MSVKFKELIKREQDRFIAEKDGYKLFPNAKFVFTKERAEEFARVSLETLIDDPYFLNMKDFIWPKVKDQLLEFEQERNNRLIHTCAMFGAIGISKTSRLSILTYWQLFELLTTVNMVKYFGVAPDKTSALIMLSKDASASKKVTFMDLLPIIIKSPFIRDYFPPQVDISKLDNNPERLPSELRFPKKVHLFPGTGHAASVLGYNVYGGGMDEVNDMQYTDKSKKAKFKEYYSAAEESYREILERMNSRFPYQTLHRAGKKHGFVTLVGQTRYPASFSETIKKQAVALGNESGIYVTCNSRWEIHPESEYLSEKFLFDLTNKKVIEIVNKRHNDLGKCLVCETTLKDWAYQANKGLVCSVDCYKESFKFAGEKHEVEKV